MKNEIDKKRMSWAGWRSGFDILARAVLTEEQTLFPSSFFECALEGWMDG